MVSRIFISHSGDDSIVAMEVAQALEAAGLSAVLDRDRIQAGDSFITFMEGALSTSDSCLLLWSESASSSAWVQAEWETALLRTIEGARGFLVVGRLDEHPLPALLSPRLFVVLHPQISPGIDELILVWRRDFKVTEATGRPVASAPSVPTPTGDQNHIYVTSDYFAITTPISVDLHGPAGSFLDCLRAALDLPAQLDYDGKLGVRFEYRLRLEDHVLNRGLSLSQQGVEPGGVLWLEFDMVPFSAKDPIQGELSVSTFRSDDARSDWQLACGAARSTMLKQVEAMGLGMRSRVGRR